MRDFRSWGKTKAPKLGGKLRQSRIALVVGTRPEAIKLSPVAHALADLGERPTLFVTGQHPGLELADHRLDKFEAIPLSCPGQADPVLHADLVRAALSRALPDSLPRLIVVQGDTSSALGGALAAKQFGIPMAHVEAGLRSHDPLQPWPEEENRVKIDRLADILFAPTSGNAANLREEEVSGQIHVTGNSGIDALLAVTRSFPRKTRPSWLPRTGFRLLVTCHRRENWESGIGRLMSALGELASDGVKSDVLLPPNPSVTLLMRRCVGNNRRIRLVAPLTHAATIEAMRRADVVLSDSGGMQEEAPALGIPLLVLRDKTERPEGISSGSMELVGIDPGKIVSAVRRLREDRTALKAMAVPALPFGDGYSAPRIARHCLEFLASQDAIDGRRRG